MAKSKRNRKPGYFLEITKQMIGEQMVIDMVKTLGIAEGRRLQELDERYVGGDFSPDIIWVMVGPDGSINGVTVVWDSDKVTFARRSGYEFLAFARGHMDEIASKQGVVKGYDNPMELYRLKAAQKRINCIVVNYIQINYGGA